MNYLPTTIENLPNEMLEKIFNDLPSEDRNALSCVSIQFHHLIITHFKIKQIYEALKNFKGDMTKINHVIIDILLSKKELINDKLLRYSGIINIPNLVDVHVLTKINSLMTQQENNNDLDFLLSIHDQATRQLEEQCQSLKTLKNVIFRGLDTVNSKSIKLFTKHCQNLENIDLSYCNSITNNAIKALAENYPELQRITLSDCQLITDQAIVALAKHCKHLQSIDLFRCFNVTDQAIIALADHCPELQEIILTHCKRITDHSISILIKRCEQLEHLGLSGFHLNIDQSFMSLSGAFRLKKLFAFYETCDKEVQKNILTIFPNLIVLAMNDIYKNGLEQINNYRQELGLEIVPKDNALPASDLQEVASSSVNQRRAI